MSMMCKATESKLIVVVGNWFTVPPEKHATRLALQTIGYNLHLTMHIKF